MVLLNTQKYKVRIKSKVEQSRECSSYRKGSFRVTLDYGRQLIYLLRARVDHGAMAMKRYSVFPKAPVLPKPHHQNLWCHIQGTHRGSLTSLYEDLQSMYTTAQAAGPTFIREALKSHTDWSDAQCVREPTTTMLPSTVNTSHGFNCIGHMIYAIQTSL